jgi:hypothetical protein
VCGAAYSCPKPGDIQYWVWEATVDRATGRVIDPPGWVLQGRPVCLGPEDAGVPATAAIGGILSRDLQDLVVLKGVAHVDPNGRTLVNYETGFWTEAKRYVLPAITLLGHRVVVTATPESYDWYFGDGAKALDAGPGRQGALDVSHTYDGAADVRPNVVITWSGTYTVDGAGPYPVIGTAVTTGPGTPLEVREAKAQLVSR